jgi:hypothetical protein
MAGGLPIITMKNIEGVSDIFTPEVFSLVGSYDPYSVAKSIENVFLSLSYYNKKRIQNFALQHTWDKKASEYEKEFISLLDNL